MSILINDKAKKAFINKLVESNESNLKLIKVIAALPLTEKEKKKQIAALDKASASVKASAKIIEDLLKSLVSGKPNEALIKSKIVSVLPETKKKVVNKKDEVKVKKPRTKKVEAEISKPAQ